MLKFDEKRWRATPCLEGGVPYYLLVEERLGHRIRLFEIEFKLLQYFDGSRSLQRFAAHFAPTFKSQSVLSRLRTLSVDCFSVSY